MPRGFPKNKPEPTEGTAKLRAVAREMLQKYYVTKKQALREQVDKLSEEVTNLNKEYHATRKAIKAKPHRAKPRPASRRMKRSRDKGSPNPQENN